MGFLRFFLAVSVIVGHTAPIYGMQLMPASTAVWLFFIISGFYMQLVFSTGPYANDVRGFYSSRFLRLWPTFFLAFVLCVVVEQQLPGSALPLAERTLILVPNVLMIFSDVPFLFHYSEATGWLFTFGVAASSPDPDVERASMFVLNGPSWSIGLEIWFYLLVPLLVRLRSWQLWGVTLLSLFVRMFLEHAEPWSSYFFFPANLCLFSAGMLAFRYRDASNSAITLVAHRMRIQRASSLALLISVLALTLLVFREVVPFYRNYPVLQMTTLWLTISAIFESSKSWTVDRFVGELSYPIYILHAPLMDLFHLQKGPGRLIVVTCLAALLVYFSIERPVDNYRHRRFRKSVKQSP